MAGWAVTAEADLKEPPERTVACLGTAAVVVAEAVAVAAAVVVAAVVAVVVAVLVPIVGFTVTACISAN
jgi:hypothetical protein